MYRGVLLAFSRWTVPVPQKVWKSQLIKMARLMNKELSFITEDHRRVHRCTINHLTETGTPCKAEILARKLNLPVARVNTLLDEFEEHMNMFKREANGDIMETYPVTLKKTPMRMVISTGHELYAGEALGALAMPWVQKQVQGTSISGHITTECGYCQRPLHMLVDSNASVRVLEEAAVPMIFTPTPSVNSSLADIAGRFTNETVFYCSAEHAKKHRREAGGGRGILLPLKQAMYVNRILQETIFGFGGVNDKTA